MSASDRRPVVAVFGSSTLREDEPAYAEVRVLGAELATRGLAVMTGGYDGAMAAASRGANEAGGHVIGVTVDLFEKRGPVNPWVHERVHTPTIYARLDHLVREADAFVAVTGGIVTLTEIFIAGTMLAVSARPTAPLVLMGGHWRGSLARILGLTMPRMKMKDWRFVTSPASAKRRKRRRCRGFTAASITPLPMPTGWSRAAASGLLRLG